MYVLDVLSCRMFMFMFCFIRRVHLLLNMQQLKTSFGADAGR